MLAMSEVNCIKTLRNEKGLSITEIAKTMQVNWRTAKKYGDGDQLPQEKTHLKKGMMYDEKWGEIVVDVDSFEDWYAGQFHYEKVNGERPGKKYGKTLSPLTVAKVLGIPRSTANDLMNDGIVEFIWVDGKRRIKRESFDKWYASQSKYTKVKEIEEVEGYVD